MKDIINKLRSFMEYEEIDYLIVNSTDEFLNEYTDLSNNSRYALTGFSGSTGDALVTKTNIYLFVDGRYHLQADNEVDKDAITIEKLDMNTSIRKATIDKIKELSSEGQTVGIAASKISLACYKSIKNAMQEIKIKIKELYTDPVINLSDTHSNKKQSEVRYILEYLTGLSSNEKVKIIYQELQNKGIDVLILTKLDEIAYISNLRGNDLPYSCIFKSKAVLYDDKCCIFADTAMENYGNIEFKPLDSFDDFLCSFKDRNMSIGVTPDSISLKDYRVAESSNNSVIEMESSPIAQMKAVKTEAELEHMRFCFRKTDIAINRAIQWVNQSIEKGEKISEKDLSKKVSELFKEEGAISLSFEVIAASGKNTAIIHYTSPDENTLINRDDLVLIDCGAYFEGGLATDITRTFLAGGSKGEASGMAKKIYTKVLKAFLNGLNYQMQDNTTGFDIDEKVRAVINENNEEGFCFPHGTGHGVGIPVHEEPPRLGSSELSKTVLKHGMCFTIEPGMYCNCWGGVRLENTVTLGRENGKLKIISLVRSKFDENLIDLTMLTDLEKGWFVEYQKKATG